MKRITIFIVVAMFFSMFSVAQAGEKPKVYLERFSYPDSSPVLLNGSVGVVRGQGTVVLNSERLIVTALVYAPRGAAAPDFVIAAKYKKDTVRIIMIAGETDPLMVEERNLDIEDGPQVNPFSWTLTQIRNPLFEPTSVFGKRFTTWLKANGISDAEACIPNFGFDKRGVLTLGFACGGAKAIKQLSKQLQ